MEFSRVAVRLGGGEVESKLETIRKPKEVPLHICIIHVCKKKIHRIHPMENETNESHRRLNILFGFDEMIEWSTALNFLRSYRCCPRIESIKCS